MIAQKQKPNRLAHEKKSSSHSATTLAPPLEKRQIVAVARSQQSSWKCTFRPVGRILVYRIVFSRVISLYERSRRTGRRIAEDDVMRNLAEACTEGTSEMRLNRLTGRKTVSHTFYRATITTTTGWKIYLVETHHRTKPRGRTVERRVTTSLEYHVDVANDIQEGDGRHK